ncbi:Fic family protein [Staphylococcus debuckii]|uniref:Fic family protein n=1 Tax=Staphylococcus debuckii TaxID=2044912 RepID=A0ABU9EZI7_9STAP
MKITGKHLFLLKKLNIGVYDRLKTEFLFHSNRLEGSMFSKEEIMKLTIEKRVIGSHKLNDIIEIANSIEVFDFIAKIYNEQLSEKLLKEFHGILLNNSLNVFDSKLAGTYRAMPARLRKVELELSSPETIHFDMELLLQEYNEVKMDTRKIAEFHSKFEKIHPFHDGNGRVGRFIILKQCLDNDVDLIVVHSEYEKEYKDALYIAQTGNGIDTLVNIFEKSQRRFEKTIRKMMKNLDIYN